MAQDEPSRISRIKLHFKEHKREYLIGAGCFVAGAAAVVIFRRADVITKNTALLSYKPTQINDVTAMLVRRGHPGNIVRCIDTGEVFASQKRAAAAVGVNYPNLIKHLNGDLLSVGGHTFERLGEFGAA